MEEKNELTKVLLDSVREHNQSNKTKDKIIVLLIILMFLEAVVGYSGFVWYESQYNIADGETVEIGTEGENANLYYNNVDGNQYNDNATHNEGVDR